MLSSKLHHLPQEPTIFTTCDFFKVPLRFILIIFLDPEIAVFSLLLCEQSKCFKHISVNKNCQLQSHVSLLS